jgi:nucleotide-binding universal stress UspA family protein
VTGPILFCYDGSTGSRSALQAAADLIIRPSDGYVLTVWQPVYLQLAAAGAFVAGIPDEAEIDEQESAAAKAAADEGARLGKEHGFDLVPLTEQAQDGIAHTIMSVAERVQATLIVCGQRGRGPLRAALLGSVSHALSSHAHVPVLIAPEPKRTSSVLKVSASSQTP